MLVGKMECYTRTEPARPALARVDTASFKFSTNTGYPRTEPARPAQESLHLVGIEPRQPDDGGVQTRAEVGGVARDHLFVVPLQDAERGSIALL